MIIEGLLGTITGIIGNAVGGWFKYKERKLQITSQKIQNAHEIAMVKAETQAMIMEAKANIKITQAQVEGAIDLKDADAFIQAQKEGNKSLFSNKWIDALMKVQGWWRLITLPLASLIALLFGFVDFLRGLIRPALTVYLVGATTWITLLAWKIMQTSGLNITALQAVGIFNDVISVVTYLTVSAVTFWFGDRAMSKYIMQAKGIDTKKLDDEIKID